MEHITNRKPIFDAVRLILKRGFTPAEVAAIDAAIDRAGIDPTAAPPPPAAAHRLGALSEAFESGGAGPGAVSSGRGDPGGVSYGIWQLASRAGTAAAFVAREGSRWAADFAGLTPGGERFSAAWRAVAAREPEAFADAQRGFIERTHYRPAVAAVRAATGLDLDARADAVRDASWSVAVQHGGAARILGAGVGAARATSADADPGFDRALIEAIYAERGRYVLALATRTASQGQRQTLVALTVRRYPAELAKALAMLDAATPRTA